MRGGALQIKTTPGVGENNWVPYDDCSLPWECCLCAQRGHTTAQDKRMGPHDRAKLQAKLDLAKGESPQANTEIPRQFRMASLCRSRDLQVRVFCNQPIAFLGAPGSAVGSASAKTHLAPSPVAGSFAMMLPRDACVDSCLRYCHCCPPLCRGGYQGWGQGDFWWEEHRALLEECRYGAGGGAVAGARDGWLKRERGLSSALPLPAYTRWMGQRCHRLAS